MSKNEYESVFETALAKVEESIVSESRDIGLIEIATCDPARFDSDMDGWDIVACLSFAAISAFLTTSECFEKWLAEVHDAASKQSGDYDFIQTILGKLLEHQGDDMDQFSTRDGSDPWRLFHRLFFGHDILSRGDDINDNPFYLMFKQKGLGGLLQAVRHLIADTFSRQGLPFPGSSYFDYEIERGRPWNYLIDLVQELSQEAYGNKGQAESIYKHLLTIRAQDVAGGMAVQTLASLYLKARYVDDDIRCAQVKLVAYSMSFYAEAIVGATKQKGIPFINIPLGIAIAKEATSLMVASNTKTRKLERKTTEFEKRADKLISQHERLKALINGEGLSIGEVQDER